ncbi:NAD(P)H-binding protein [Mesohalobacter halotolerans]|uniref:NAD-dependent epimerase/dehydratase family protein n=1 Tax=Mesohalobacter halotolerans TaxID=1883405 RepID=A0A4U5TQT1_9FLAO|nr:NAD(P)H-binding protein [Mesohalobacter halotolerans]MBS3737642.1 NAD(P)H-binding protein [Psychroflexus sp.]TKS56577.1 NAD-dependent epimerase/dehydratase family protein [Mesohalobacter halotolerans]
MKNKKVTLLGATGLIGHHVLNYLIKDESVTQITTILRRKVNFYHPKVKEVVIDFKDDKAFRDAIEPQSIIYCAIGTTNKKVKGNKEKYRSVDYDIPVKAARFGLSKACNTFVLVSSVGADAKSSNFYTKLKGEVEEELSQLGFQYLHIFRPSILLGKRQEFRFAEKVAKIIMKTFSFLLPSKIRPIHANDVAKAMVEVVRQKKEKDDIQIYHYNNIIQLVQNHF